MEFRRWRGRIPALTAGAAATLCVSLGFVGATAGGTERGCTKIGCKSAALAVAKQLPAESARVRFCAGKDCATAAGMLGRVERLSTDCREGPGRIKVSVLVSDASGRTLARVSKRVKLAKHQPNGDGCPPTCWRVDVRFLADSGRLVTFGSVGLS